MDRKRKFLFTIAPVLFFCCRLHTQPAEYPKYYFRNPLAIPMEIQSNFGELRPDHWHMGLDIRTAQKENQPVYAAAPGYIARIGVRPQSFGRFIVINHPNGLSTLYAHLNDFFPELEKYVTEQQYKQESWAVELTFTADQFPVNKGQFIAFSGNTGGSLGPHLHFEIYNTQTEERLNPLLLGFPLQDNTSPTIIRLAMYDRNRSVYDQVPELFTVKNTDSGYIVPKPVVIKTGLNKLSFALQTYDRMSSRGSQDGIYAARLFLDDEPQVEFVLDSVSYDETGYINSQIDYKFRSNGGSWLQHLSRLPGDKGGVYREIRNNGVINLQDTDQHRIRVEVKDAYNNMASLNFIIQHDDSLEEKKTDSGNNVRFSPGQPNQLKRPDFEINLPSSCLYDTVGVLYYHTASSSPFSVSAIHQLNDATVPINENATVRIKPDRTIPPDWKNRIVIQRSSKGNSIRKAVWEGEWLTAKFGDFGTFQAFADLQPPQINELGKGDTVNLSAASRILFTPTDNFGIIRNFRAELDSQWIRFTNDKSRNWIYKFDERCPYGVHHLKVTVEDLAGNTTTKEWWFKRYPYTPPVKKPVKKKAPAKRNKK